MFTALLLSAFVTSPRLDAEGVPLPPEAVARVGSARWRGPAWLSAPVVSADGKHMYTHAADQSVLVWEAATGRVLDRMDVRLVPAPYEIHWKAKVGGVVVLHTDRAVFNPLQHRRLVPIADGRLRVIDFAHGHLCIRTLDPATGVLRDLLTMEVPLGQTAELTSDGKRVAVHIIDVTRNMSLDTERHFFKVFDPATKKLVFEVPIKNEVFTYGFSPDGTRLAISDGESFRVLDAATGTVLRTLRATANRPVRQLAFGPDSQTVAAWVKEATSGMDALTLWTADGTAVPTGLVNHRHMRQTLVFRPDGRQLAVGYYSRPWTFYDTATGHATTSTATTGATPYSAAYAPDGRRLYATAGKFLGHLAAIDVTANPPRLDPATDGERVAPVFGRGGNLMAVSDLNLLRWDAKTGELSRSPLTAPDPKSAWAFAGPHGDRVVTVSREPRGPAGVHVVTAHEVATGGRTAFRLTGIDYVAHISFSRDGTALFVVTPRREQIRCDLTTGQQSTRPIDMPVEPNATRRAITAGDGVLTWAVSNDPFQNGVWPAPRPVRYFGVADDKQPTWKFTPGGDPTLWPLVASDGRTVVLTTVGPRGHTLERWDGPTGRLAWRQPLENDFYIGCLSPDARTCAGTYYGELILREMASGQVRHRFVGHRGNILNSAFSPDGRTLAVASVEAPLFLWDVRGELSKPKTPPDLNAAWTQLASTDSTAAFQAVRQLAWFPEQSLPILRKKLPPAAGVTEEKLTKLIAALDAPAFADREAAMKELRALADLTVPRLEATLKKTESVEIRTRIEKLLDWNANRPRDGDYLRIIRAVEAVEWMRTPEAKKLLEAWAAGAAGARLTTEAKAALGRP